MSEQGDTASDAELDAKMIRDIRRAREGAGETWTLRLTLGEIDALLRVVDERDDLKRRLLGEWEGDLPEPKPAVKVYRCRRDPACRWGGHSVGCAESNA